MESVLTESVTLIVTKPRISEIFEQFIFVRQNQRCTHKSSFEKMNKQKKKKKRFFKKIDWQKNEYHLVWASLLLSA